MRYLDTLPDTVRAVRSRALAILFEEGRELDFNAADHTYSLRGVPLRSVSSIVSDYSRFNAEETARRCSRNARHELFGRPVEEILALWREKAGSAAAAGTAVHAYAEACYLARMGMEEAMDEAMAARLGADSLAPHTPKEAAVRLWWDSLDMERYVPVAKETQIASPELGYAGTFDLLLYDRQEGHFCLRDYKTNSDLHRHFGRTMMRPPFDVTMKDNDEGHYTLQQSLYALRLKELGIGVGDIRLVWAREDATFEEVSLPYCGELARHALTRGSRGRTACRTTNKDIP